MIDSAAEFVRLRTGSDPEQYSRAAQESASIEVWIDLVANYTDMRFWVAQNKTVPLEILRVLATDTDSNVRHMVAAKRSLDASLFELLSKDGNEAVRIRIANNSKTPTDVLESLALNDQSEQVRDEAQASLLSRK